MRCDLAADAIGQLLVQVMVVEGAAHQLQGQHRRAQHEQYPAQGGGAEPCEAVGVGRLHADPMGD